LCEREHRRRLSTNREMRKAKEMKGDEKKGDMWN